MLTYDRSNRIKALRFCMSVLGRSHKYDQAVFSSDRLCDLRHFGATNSAQVKLDAGQTRLKSNSAQVKLAQVRIGAEKK